MNINIKLESDFTDYYDGIFNKNISENTITFTRNSIDLYKRRIYLEYLQNSLHLSVIPHGIVKDVVENIYRINNNPILNTFKNYSNKFPSHLVIYFDEKAHMGEGKELLEIDYCYRNYPNFYCSIFIGDNFTSSCSYRYLQINKQYAWLQYNSTSSWKSNCGNTSCKLISCGKTLFPLIPDYPLCSIDFVKTDKLYAIDFNISPGLSNIQNPDITNSPNNIFQEIFTPQTIYQEILDYYTQK